MYFAIYMKNKLTNERRIKKVNRCSSDDIWGNDDFGFSSDWTWIGTCPFAQIEHNAIHIGGDYYITPEIQANEE